MAKSKTETQPLTPVQAKIVFDAELNPDEFLKAGASQPVNLNPGDILRNPREWAKLANLLAMKDKPPGLQLDFEKLAVYYNNAFKKASSGNPHPPKLLTAGECRKIIIALTRDQFRDATVNYKKNVADETAKQAKAEALGILRKYGWTEKASKRKKKAKGVVEAKEDAAPTAMPSVKLSESQSIAFPAQSTVAPVPVSPTKSDSALPLVTAETKPVSSATQTPIESDPKTRIYVSGYGKPHEQALLKIGGTYDRPQRKWHFPDQASADEAARIMGGK